MSIRIPRPEHPDPQWERKNWKNLNGQWEFEIDRGNSGEDREFYLREQLDSKITVPFCPESALSGVQDTDFMLAVWYQKVLTFSESELAGNRVLLHFGAADFETKLWVNGKAVGLPHVGGIGFKLETNDYGKRERKKDWSYGAACTGFEEFYERYEGLTHALLDCPYMMGFCYTQLTDVEQEKNGLYTYEGRKPKFDMAIISKINKKKAAIED